MNGEVASKEVEYWKGKDGKRVKESAADEN